MDQRVGRQPQYELFADEFTEHAQDGLYNAHYDRPACLALLGDVAGKCVLDAACGPGLYAEELLRRGAHVVGFDQSPRMVDICRGRAGQGESPCTTSVTRSAGCPMPASTWFSARSRSSTSMIAWLP